LLPYMLLTVTAHSVSRIVLKSHSPSILDRLSNSNFIILHRA